MATSRLLTVLGLLLILWIDEAFSQTVECNSPLGMASGAINTTQLTASNLQPGDAKLDKARYGCCEDESPGGFCADGDNVWFRIDFPNRMAIKRIALQAPAKSSYYVKLYNLRYAIDDTSDLTVFKKNGKPVDIAGIPDSKTLSSNTTFSQPVIIKKIRFDLIDSSGLPCFRLELYGCKATDLCPKGCENGGQCTGVNKCTCTGGFKGDRCEIAKKPIDLATCKWPLGMKSGYIKNSQLEASSTDPNLSVYQARMDCCQDQDFGGWCADPTKAGKGQWIQIKFQVPMGITKILTQKPYRNPNSTEPLKFIFKYTLEYRDEGTGKWMKFTGKNPDKALAIPAVDPLNPDKEYFITLTTPIYTRILRMLTAGYVEQPCIRFELYGCDPNGCTPPCLNGATCEKDIHKCKCRNGFAGRQCELTKQNINHYELSVFNITDDTLYTKNGTYRVHGNVTLEDGVIGQTMVIDTKTQYIDLGNWRQKCMGNLELCSYGVGISLYVRFQSQDDMYILSSGGDLDDSYGVAIYRKANVLNFVASTKKRKWSMTLTEPLKNNTWYKLEMYWQNEGVTQLEAYINGEKLDSNVTVENRDVKDTTWNNFYFGRTAASSRRKREIVEADLEIEGPDFWEVDREILTEFEIVTGFPQMSGDPKITAKITESADGQDQVDFHCRMPEVDDRLVNYDVEWMLNDDIIHTDTIKERAGVSVLKEEQIEGRINVNSVLRCRVQSCYPAICADQKSPPQYSNALQPHIQVLTPNKITVEEGGDASSVDFKLNLPPRFFCGCNITQECDMRISVTIPKSPSDMGCLSGTRIPQAVIGWAGRVLSNASCGVQITDMNWNETFSAIVKAKLDGKADKNQNRQIELKVHCYYNETTVITTSKNKTVIQVTVIDKDKLSVCKSVNDPHMYTFDGRAYDNFLEGEFVLYRHKTLPYQVNTFYRKCGSLPTCNCAVSIKSGDDVIVIDICGSRMHRGKRPITVNLFQNGELTPGTRIFRLNGGNKYEVHLPLGNVITVQTSMGFLNVWMTASAQDFNQTEGLCGSFDGNVRNDLTTPQGKLIQQKGRYPNDFSHSWRENKTTSIYKGICPDDSSTGSKSEPERNDDIYCECTKEWENKCGVSYDTIVCPQQEKTTSNSEVTDYYVQRAKTPDFCEKPNKETEFEFNETWIPIPPTWPTESGITEQMAKEYCENYVRVTAAAKTCGAFIQVSMEVDIKGCVEDIKLTGSYQWAVVAVEAVKQACAIHVEYDITLWKLGSGGIIIPPTEITDTLCLNDCSNNGACKTGICQCNLPFAGPDCSINRDDPPIVISIPNGGLCESTKRCRPITVYGEKFLESPDLTCHVQRIEPSETGFTIFSPTRKFKGHFISFNEVECEVDFSVGYASIADSCTVTISNNGVTESRTMLLFIIYNPACQICETKNGRCITKDKTCFISNSCYKEGDVNPRDPSYSCIPTESKTKWSHKSNLQIHIHIKFDIIVSIITTQYYNITRVGSVELVDGREGKGWLLKGGCLDFGESTEDCFNNIDKCEKGITMTFWAKFQSIAENTYILSKGGQATVGKGFAFLYRYGQLQVMFKNSRKAWFLPCGSLQTNSWTLFEISWQETKGLVVYINKMAVQQQVITHTHTSVVTTDIVDLMFGCPSPSETDITPIRVVIDELQMWTVSIDILIIQGVIGERGTTPAPTTTIASTPSTATSPATTSAAATQPATTTELYTGTTPRPTCPSWCIGGNFPHIDKPKLTYNDTKKSIIFYCHLPVPTDENVEYKVEWVSGTRVIYTEKWRPVNKSSATNVSFDLEDHTEANLQVDLFCQVKARFGGPCKGGEGKPEISNKFIAVIQIITKTITVIEGGKFEIILIRFKAPPIFFCDRTKIGPEGCILRLEGIFQLERSEWRCRTGAMIHQAVVGWEGNDVRIDNAFCGVLVTSSNWNKLLELKIKAKVDGKYDRDLTRICNVVIRQIYLEQVVMVKVFGVVKVTIINRDLRAICSSVNDPHMKTFDGLRYDNFFNGEFVLYQHKTLKLQINGFYVHCGGRSKATCNCGVAVKSGDDVIVFNKCQKVGRGRAPPFLVYMFKNGQLTNGTKILRIGSGNKYEVHLPTGTFMTVQSAGMFINIWVTPSAADFNNTIGLCGTYDRNTKNDLMKRDGSTFPYPFRGRPDSFSIHWRVPGSESIFYGVYREFLYTYEPIWCDCLEQSQSCGVKYDIEMCDAWIRGTDVTQLLIKEAHAPNPPRARRRRATDPPETPIHKDNVIYQPISYDKNFKPGIATWPTASGWTEQKAKTYCSDYITKTKAAENCGKLLNDTFSNEINSCVEDIKVSDDTSWAETALASIKQDCATEASRYTAETENATAPKVDLPGDVELKDIETSVCPKNCGGKGTCTGGACKCNERFFGDACELSKSDPPVLTSMQRNGLCDVRTRDCKTSVVYGTKFIESNDLSCKVTPYNIKTNQRDAKTFTTNATYVNINQVMCVHPNNQGSYIVSVSNDGKTYSKAELLSIGYDSVCYTCKVTDEENHQGACDTTNTGCEIENVCYKAKSTNPSDKCKICDPTASRNSWIDNPSEDCGASSARLNDADIAIICIVLGILLILLILTLVYVKCLRKKKPKAERYSQPPVKFIKGKYTGSTRPPNQYDASPMRSSHVPMQNPAFEDIDEDADFHESM